VDPVVVPTLKASASKPDSEQTSETAESAPESKLESEAAEVAQEADAEEVVREAEAAEEAVEESEVAGEGQEAPKKPKQFTFASVKAKKMALQQKQPLVFNEVPFMQVFSFIPEYLEVNFDTCSAAFLRTPTVKSGRSELPSPLPAEQHSLAYEYYSRMWKRKAFSVIQQRLVQKGKKLAAAKLRPRKKFQRRGTYIGRGPFDVNKPGTIKVMGRSVKLKRHFEKIARLDARKQQLLE
jgi:hypothetical protein